MRAKAPIAHWPSRRRCCAAPASMRSGPGHAERRPDAPRASRRGQGPAPRRGERDHLRQRQEHGLGGRQRRALLPGRTLQADRVPYDRKSGRVFAQGNARIIDANGAVITGDRLDLTEDFKNGFIDSLRVQQTVSSAAAPAGPVSRRPAPSGSKATR